MNNQSATISLLSLRWGLVWNLNIDRYLHQMNVYHKLDVDCGHIGDSEKFTRSSWAQSGIFGMVNIV